MLKIRARARSALAKQEAAEELSRSERIDEAREAFLKAARLYEKARELIEIKCDKPLDRKEKEMAIALLEASEKKHEYCCGRVVLEEAKIQDRKGDHLNSSRKYELAAKIFESVAIDAEEPGRRQLLSAFYLCQALAKMKLAEETKSSKTYEEAAELFNQAKEHSLDRDANLLALANNCFCRALASGTQFEITRDTASYSDAKKLMEVAEHYYLNANQESASDYTKATEELMDAYMYITKAETETELAEKAKHYGIAERILKTSMEAYSRAKHPDKSAEVQKLIKCIDEKRQQAVSLLNVLPESSITATTDSFSAPNPIHKGPTEFERFAHAKLKANLTVSKEATLKAQVKVTLDIVNVGSQPGLLLRIRGLVQPGFKIASSSPRLEIEDDLIEMKGRRIDPLAVDSLRFSLQPAEIGTFDLKPQIIYFDDVGHFRSCFPKPKTMSVYANVQRFPTKTYGAALDERVVYLASKVYRDYMTQIEISKAQGIWTANRNSLR